MCRQTPVRTTAAALVLALLPSFAVGQEREQEKDKGAKPKPQAASAAKSSAAKETPVPEKPRYDARSDDVITNEDLERMMEGLSPLEARTGVYQSKPTPVTTETPGDTPAATPVAKGEPGAPAKPAGPNGPVADAEGRVAALQARVSELEKAVLAVKNPLLPRTWTKPESTKEQDAESGYEALDNRERLAQREAELSAAREELSQARQDLAALRGGSDAP